MSFPVKRILLFLLPFSAGVGVLFVVVGTQDLISPLPKLGPSADPRADESQPASALGATLSGPATMKGVSFIEPKTLTDGTQVTHYKVRLGKAQIHKLSPSLSDLSDATGALSENPELTLYNQKPPPEERALANVTARWGRGVPYERKENDASSEARLREIQFQDHVLARIFDLTGNDFLVATESLRVMQVSPNPNEPKFEVTSDVHVVLTKEHGGLHVDAEGFVFQVALGLLALQPPVHAEGVDFTLPAIDSSAPHATKLAAVPVMIDCKGKAFFHRVDDDAAPSAASTDVLPFRAGSLVFHDDVVVRQGEDWWRGDRLRVNLRSMQKPGAETESLQPAKCMMESSTAPVLFDVHGFAGECQSLQWTAAEHDVVLAGPCRISGRSFPALAENAAAGEVTSLVLRARDRAVWHANDDATATVTLIGDARIEDADANPLLRGAEIVFHLRRDTDASGAEAWHPTSIVADGRAVLDHAATHIAGTRVLLRERSASGAGQGFDLSVLDVTEATLELPDAAGAPARIFRLTPLAAGVAMTRADGTVTVTGRAIVRMPVDGGADRDLTADQLILPEATSEGAAQRLTARGTVILNDPTQGVHLTSESLLLPLQGSTQPAEATGAPVHLEVPMQGGTAQIDAPRLEIDQLAGKLVAHDGALLRLPAATLKTLLASPMAHGAGAAGEALLHAEVITITGRNEGGSFQARTLTACGAAEVASRDLTALGDTLDLDLEQRTGMLVGSALCLAQVLAKSIDGRPLQTLLAPLILLEDSGKALRAPHDGVVWMWSDLPSEAPSDRTDLPPPDPDALERESGARYGRMSARNELLIREERITARDDVYVHLVEAGPARAKEYHIRCDAADADLVRRRDAEGRDLAGIEQIVAMGSVRLQSTEIKGRSDVLTLSFRSGQDGKSELQTLFAEGRGRPCWIEHLGREMFTKSVLFNRITQALQGDDLRLVGSSP